MAVRADRRGGAGVRLARPKTLGPLTHRHAGFRARGAAAAALVLLSAACSSTNESKTRAGSKTKSDAAVADASGAFESGTGDEQAPAGSGGAATPAERAKRGGNSSGGSAATSGVTPGRRGTPAQAVTGTEIRVGVMYVEGVTQIIGAFGVKGYSNGDNKRQAQSVIDVINKSGGIAGRKIVPFYVSSDLNNGTYSSQAEQLCTSWTEDSKIFVGVGSAYDLSTQLACMAKKGTPFVPTPNLAGPGFLDPKTVADNANIIYGPAMSDPRVLTTFINRLVARGFLAKTNKIGLIRVDDQKFTLASNNVFKPALARHGLKLTTELVTKHAGTVPEVSNTAAAMSNAVLRFRAAGIDRITFLEDNGALPFLFQPQAENQGYRPKYAFSTFDMPNFVEANGPPAQLAGSMGVGWQPTLDVGTTKDPGGRPGAARCAQIFRSTGQTFPDRGVENYATSYCDSLFFLKTVLDKAPAITAAGLRSAVDALGSSYGSALTFATRFGANRHLAVAAVRDLTYSSKCNCYEYSGGNIPLP